MGDFFEPDIESESLVSGYQQQIQALLAKELPGMFAEGTRMMPARRRALFDVIKSGPTDISGVQAAALRNYSENIAPMYDEAAAGRGSLMSTRVPEMHRKTLGDIGAQMGALSAQMMENWRNRQLGAAAQILQERYAPLGTAGQFSTAVSQENIVQPSWGSQVLGAGTTLGSAAMLGFGGGKGASPTPTG